MPVIISSYSSTNIQGKSSKQDQFIYLIGPGHGNEEEELKNTIDSDQIEVNKENDFSASQKKSGGVKEESKNQSVSEEKEDDILWLEFHI